MKQFLKSIGTFFVAMAEARAAASLARSGHIEAAKNFYK